MVYFRFSFFTLCYFTFIFLFFMVYLAVFIFLTNILGAGSSPSFVRYFGEGPNLHCITLYIIIREYRMILKLQ